MNTDKALHLMQAVDLSRPELKDIPKAGDRAGGFVNWLARSARPRFRFEFERKREMRDFLKRNYAAWRRVDTTAADRLAAFPIKKAQGPRALAGIAALGRAWWATGNPEYGKAFERFYRAVPTGEMFNWGAFNGTQGDLELDAYFLLLDCPGFSTEGRIEFLDHFQAIAEFAWEREVSRWLPVDLGPEGHNWYLHGIRAATSLGLLFPEFKRASFLLRSGASVIEEHVRGHYRADGGARETTLGYQAGSMHNLWIHYLLAKRNGYPLSADFEATVLRATKFLLKLMSPQAGLPSFGDGGHTPGGCTQLAAIAAAATGDRECKWYAEVARAQLPSGARESKDAIPLCAFWDVGLEGAATYAATQPKNPHGTSVLMGDTGYAALRDTDESGARYLAIAAADRGPIVTSHGHNDILSIEAHADGVRFLGEMGCAPYGNSPGRDYDQKTEAHNCLTIEGREQVPLISEWRWEHAVIPAVRRWISEDTHDFFHGVHEGFYHWPDNKILHARKVFFVKAEPSYWIVLDWVESNVKNPYRIYFHGCVPGRRRGKSLQFGEGRGPALAVIPASGQGLTVKPVVRAGLKAYIREKGLDPKRCPAFVYAKRAASDCLAWALVPLAGRGFKSVRTLPVKINGVGADPHSAVAVQMSFRGVTDTLCVSHRDYDAGLEFNGQTAWGNLAFRRTDRKGRVLLSLGHTIVDGVCGR
jgi:hypothetical protein